MLRVVQIGLGPIGRSIAQRALRHACFEFVGAVDPVHAGRDAGELLGTGGPCVEVQASIDGVLDNSAPDLVLHATGSWLDEIAGQFEPMLSRGIPVVSTCEELAYPFYRHPDLSRKLDASARRTGAVLLGTGVNPGFVMDKLVITLMAACDTVSSVTVRRTVDAAKRRVTFQRKVGAGMAPSEFEARRTAGKLGHVGLAESAHMLADAMGVGPDRTIDEELGPVLAERRVSSEHLSVEVGQVAGIHQTVSLESAGKRVFMELQMYLGAGKPGDSVSIEGSPPLAMEITSGVPGDEGTAAVTISTARIVRSLEPGLRTMLDVPLRPGVSTS